MYKCKCRLDSSVCNNKKCWNDDKCRCEWEKLIHKRCLIKDLFEILVNVSVNVINHVFSEYLDYKNCTCKKKLVDKLIEECTENVEEVKIAKIALAED